MTAGLHELIDATGGGCAELGADDTIASASSGFIALVGAPDDHVGAEPGALISELPALDQLPLAVEAETPVFRQVGADGIGRELAAALVPGEVGRVLILVDRSGEARLRRSQARLGRQVDDLKAELAARERAPRRPQIRSMAELARRLDEALARARRYRHHVTIVSIQIERADADDAKQIGESLVGCVRGVDDLGRVDQDHWVLVLPHTPLAGGEVVAKRVHARLAELGLSTVGVGVAQVGDEEPGSEAVDRADQAGSQALESGGGLLLAVALT
jgi:GGDEF domain-containing protein